MDTLLSPLVTAGMDTKIAEIYLVLAQNGELDVPTILSFTALSRTTVYESLSELLAQGFVEYQKKGRVALYRPVHPNKVYSLLQNKKNELTLLESELGGVVNALLGPFQLMQNKPGVRFFEGEEGFAEALHNTLSSKEEVCTFVDLLAVEKYVKEINDRYVEMRRKKRIPKRLLVLDTSENRAFMQKQGGDLSDFRYLPKTIQAFQTGMQIYDGKISYLTLRKQNISAVIITDRDIYDFQKQMFDMLWNQAAHVMLPASTQSAVADSSSGFAQTPSPSDPFAPDDESSV